MATNLEQLRAQHPNLSDDAIADLAALTLKMSGNKKTRSGFLGILKEVAPDTPIPELETREAIEQALAKRDDEIAKLRKERDDDKFSAALAAQKNEARTKFGLSDEDVAKMEEMMKKGELPADYRFAPQLYKAQTESATPTNYGSGGYGPLGIEQATKEKGFEGLMDDPDNWARSTAHQMIDDMTRKGRAPAF